MSDTPVSVTLFTRAGSILDTGLEATGGPKYSVEYVVPKDRPLDSYLVEFTGSYKGAPLNGYLSLDVVLATDADFAELSEKSESSITYDGTSVTFDSPSDRLKALQALKPPQVGRITKKRSLGPNSCDDTRDYSRRFRGRWNP